jgi:hypothetical protein
LTTITIPKDIKRALNATGLPWRAEQRSRHIVLYLNSRMLTSLSFGAQSMPKVQMVLNDIRRHMRRHRA